MFGDLLTVTVYVMKTFVYAHWGYLFAIAKQGDYEELLQRLSDGTGIAVGLLGQMSLGCIWKRLIEEMSQYTKTPEGQAKMIAAQKTLKIIS